MKNSTGNYLDQAYDFYLWTLTLADERTKGWPLVDSPVPTLIYIAIYLFLVWIGPKYMKNRPPFRLKWLLVPYNLCMAALNAYIAVQLLIASTKLRYSYICEPCRQRYHPDELKVTNAVWWYYFSKLLEFCDTFFFILRKKDQQLTFLHVYHHSTMFFLWWIGIKWVPSGSSFLPAMVNSGIHVLMYSYYGLSALGPAIGKYLWWKKYLTILQMIQFTTALILGANGIRTGCDFPLWMHYTLIVYMLSFIVLFGNFYVKAYMEKGNQVFFGMDVGCGQGNTYSDKNGYKNFLVLIIKRRIRDAFKYIAYSTLQYNMSFFVTLHHCHSIQTFGLNMNPENNNNKCTTREETSGKESIPQCARSLTFTYSHQASKI